MNSIKIQRTRVIKNILKHSPLPIQLSENRPPAQKKKKKKKNSAYGK